MSLPGRLLGLSSGTRAAASTSKAPPPAAATQSVGYTSPGMPMTARWNADTAVKTGYYGYVYAYRCARTIAATIAGLPFRAGLNPNTTEQYNLRAPLAALLGPPPGGPTPNISPRALWTWSLTAYLITGRFAWETACPPGTKQPAALWPLVAANLMPIPTDGGREFFSGFEYQANAKRRPMTLDQVFYAWRPSQDDWREPESALQAAALPLGLGISLDRYMSSFMQNNMTGAKMVVTPGFEDTSMRRAFQDQFLSEMTGYDNAGRTAFAEWEDDSNSGKIPSVQVIDMGTKPIDAQITDLQKWVRDTVCDAFGVPVSIVGQASERTYANADQEHRNYWTGTILPFIEEICDHINIGLAPRLGDEVGWFDLSQVAALKPASRFAQADPVALVTAGVVDDSELRADLGLSPDKPAAGTAEPPEPLPAVDDTPGASHASTGGLGGGRSGIEVIAVADGSTGDRAGICTGPGPCDTTPFGSGHNWVNKVGGLPEYIRAVAHAFRRKGMSESEAIERAVGEIRNWAEGKQHVTAQTRAKAAAALAEWEAKKAAAHGSRDMGAGLITEASSSGALLPRGVVRKVITHLPTRGAIRGICGTCGQKVSAKIHRTPKRRTSGSRHAGPGHAHVRTGHDSYARRMTWQQVDAKATSQEPAMADALKTLFAQQRKATLDRLNGNRGRGIRSAFDGNRAANDEQPPAQQSPLIPVMDAAQIYDLAHWVSKTDDALRPSFAAIGGLAGEHMARFGSTPAARQAIADAVRSRGAALAHTVSQTTLQQIQDAIANGLSNGETIAQLTAAINTIFDDADTVRAALIARTEAIGALNSAADAHAAALGPSVVAGKEWIATMDHRTRPTHAAVDRQVAAVGTPFLVGGFPMEHPGDPAAPPDEVCNCRCTTGYLTPSEYARRSGAQIPETTPEAA